MRLIDKDELKHARFHMDKYYTKVVPYSIESEESKRTLMNIQALRDVLW